MKTRKQGPVLGIVASILSVFVLSTVIFSSGVEAVTVSELKDQCDRLAQQVNNIKNKKQKKKYQAVIKANCNNIKKSNVNAKAKKVAAALKDAGGTTAAAAKKKYKEECKTAAAKKKAKCKKLATAAGITSSPGTGGSAGSTIKKCGGVATAFNYGCDGADSKSGGNDNPIFQVLFFIVNIVALGVGMVAVGGVIYGAILYTSAGDNGEQTKKGIHIIVNAVLGVTLFAFMYAILNFLVPGGLFT